MPIAKQEIARLQKSPLRKKTTGAALTEKEVKLKRGSRRRKRQISKIRAKGRKALRGFTKAVTRPNFLRS